jgi:Na+-driven multidrug efflux pump
LETISPNLKENNVPSDNYKKIASNSIILYFRLIITTIIGLYVSRVVLLQLGVDNYGLYAVVGGIVYMMNFLNTTMLATTNRFVAVEIGKGENGNINKILNTSFIIHIILALLLIITAETVGRWYINNYLNITNNRIPDALFVLHFSVIATVFSIISLPFQGLITAKEKFTTRSIIEIISALLKLIFISLLTLYLGNKLRIYSMLMTITILVPTLLFILYCVLKDKESVRWKFNQNISDYKVMVKFSGWMMLGTTAQIGVRQGVALMLNFFFGTVINASFGIASQVFNSVMMFVQNLNQAAVPQIMKIQSSGDKEKSISIVYHISKYVFFVMLLISVPFLLSIDTILSLWLKEVPIYTKQFTILMIINGLVGSVGSSLGVPVHAQGDIKKTQIWYSLLLLAVLPIGYLMFKIGYPPYIITIITIGATLTNVVVQTIITAEKTVFKIKDYLFKSIFPILMVTLSVLPHIILRRYFGVKLIDILSFSLLSVCLMIVSIYFFGLNFDEKRIIKNQLPIIRDKIKIIKHHLLK